MEGLVAGAALATSSVDSSPPEPSVNDSCVEVGVGVKLDNGGGNLWRPEDNLSWRAMISSPCCPTSAVSALTPLSRPLPRPLGPGRRPCPLAVCQEAGPPWVSPASAVFLEPLLRARRSIQMGMLGGSRGARRSIQILVGPMRGRAYCRLTLLHQCSYHFLGPLVCPELSPPRRGGHLR